MPNYKRQVPQVHDCCRGGIARMYLNAAGQIVIEYASGNIVTMGSAVEPTPFDTLDGGFAGIDHLIEIDAGDATTTASTEYDAGGAFITL